MSAVLPASCLLAGIYLMPLLIVSLISTLVESMIKKSVLDELTVPATAALALWLLA